MKHNSHNPAQSDIAINPVDIPHQGLPSHELDNGRELLNDHQLSTFLGAIGNNEGKALLLLAMAKGGDTYTSRSLHTLVTDLPGMSNVETGGVQTQKSWCDSSLEPIGMVEKSKSGGFHATSLGVEIGVPLAGLLLDHSDKYNVPLVELFGENRSSSGISSQFIRLRIIEELLTNPSGIKLSDLVESSGASNQVVIEKQLRKLSNAGLISYDDWDEATNETRYEINPGTQDSLGAKSGFIGTIAQYILQASNVTHKDIISHLAESEPEFANLKPEEQSQKVASAMHRLKAQDLVLKVEGRELPSEINISLTPEQLKQWTDLCNKLEVFKTLRPEILAEWKDLAFEFINDPERVRNAYERYRDSSARANPTVKNLGNIVLRVLEGVDRPAPVREIVKQASSLRGSSVSHFGIVAALNRLASEGLVEKREDRVLMFSKRQ